MWTSKLEKNILEKSPQNAFEILNIEDQTTTKLCATKSILTQDRKYEDFFKNPM